MHTKISCRVCGEELSAPSKTKALEASKAHMINTHPEMSQAIREAYGQIRELRARIKEIASDTLAKTGWKIY